MKGNKISVLLAGVILTGGVLTGCTGGSETEKSTSEIQMSSESDVVDESFEDLDNGNNDGVVETETESKTSVDLGLALAEQFRSILQESDDYSSDEIVTKLVSNKDIPFEMIASPVEPGLLTGFDNTEITGFKEATMFAPAIGTIPFVGYIFYLDSTDNVGTFEHDLMENANMNWNVCTSANRIVVNHESNKVIFIMYRIDE